MEEWPTYAADIPNDSTTLESENYLSRLICYLLAYSKYMPVRMSDVHLAHVPRHVGRFECDVQPSSNAVGMDLISVEARPTAAKPSLRSHDKPPACVVKKCLGRSG